MFGTQPVVDALVVFPYRAAGHVKVSALVAACRHWTKSRDTAVLLGVHVGAFDEAGLPSRKDSAEPTTLGNLCRIISQYNRCLTELLFMLTKYLAGRGGGQRLLLRTLLCARLVVGFKGVKFAHKLCRASLVLGSLRSVH